MRRLTLFFRSSKKHLLEDDTNSQPNKRKVRAVYFYYLQFHIERGSYAHVLNDFLRTVAGLQIICLSLHVESILRSERFRGGLLRHSLHEVVLALAFRRTLLTLVLLFSPFVFLGYFAD